MSGFLGADTEQLRSHAHLLKDRAKSLRDLKEQLGPRVLDESSWTGPDAESFRAQWRGDVAQRFESTAQSLGDRAEVLERQADEQDDASASKDHSVLDIITSLISGTGRGIIDAATGVVLGGMKIWNSLRNMKDPKKLLEKLRGMKGKVFDGILTKLGSFEGLMKKAPWLLKTGKVFGKLLPGLDMITGGWQMIDSIREGDTFHAITGGATTLGGALITAGTICDMTGVGAVVGVPLQVIGGVLVGGALVADGVKWAVDNWQDIKDFSKRAWEGGKDLIHNTGKVVSDTWNDGVDAVKDRVSDIKDTITDKVSGAANGLKHAFGL